MRFRVPDNFYAAAALDDGVALGNGVAGVVSAFGVNVGANFANDGANVRLGKDDDGVDVGNGRDDFCTFVFRHDRTSLAFQGAHGLIRVDGDDKPAAQRLGSAQITHVPDMQQVEGAIGQDDPFAGAAPLPRALAELVAIQDFAFFVQSASVNALHFCG